MPDKEYTYEIIANDNDAREAAQLIAEEFAAHNPITCFDRIPPQQFYDVCAWPIMQQAWPEGLSFLARHRSTGQIVAATTAGDLYLQHQNQQPAERLHEIAVDDLLAEMDHLFVSRDFGEELKANMVLHITLGAVRNAHAGKGIASELRKTLCDYARERNGFEYVLVQTTNPATRHIYLNKMNGKEMTVVDPTNWRWRKNDEEWIYPYKDYQGGLIPNILVRL